MKSPTMRLACPSCGGSTSKGEPRQVTVFGRLVRRGKVWKAQVRCGCGFRWYTVNKAAVHTAQTERTRLMNVEARERRRPRAGAK